jgi:ribosomal protein L40E
MLRDIMAERNVPRQHSAERVDADAVCARCGAVNPEDTLLCKVCGNNLRDQRARRLAVEQPVEPPVDTVERRKWVSATLAVLGLLVVLWVMLNADNIARGLVGAIVEDRTFTLGLWSGEKGEKLNELARALDAAAPALEQQMLAIREPLVIRGLDGVYVLAQESGNGGVRPVGTGIVRQEGDEYYFVGRTEFMEYRGTGRVNDSGFFVVDWGFAGYREGAKEYEVRGAAELLEDGGAACFAQTLTTTGPGAPEALETESVTFYAFQVHANS